jgi:hypothetical protein
MGVAYSLQALIVMFSMFAGLFWTASALGRTVPSLLPWRDSEPVMPADLPAHQAKWNALAAVCAAVAALAQGFLFLLEHPLPLPPTS